MYLSCNKKYYSVTSYYFQNHVRDVCCACQSSKSTKKSAPESDSSVIGAAITNSTTSSDTCIGLMKVLVKSCYRCDLNRR